MLWHSRPRRGPGGGHLQEGPQSGHPPNGDPRVAAPYPALLPGTLLRGAGEACGTAPAGPLTNTSLSKLLFQHSSFFVQICTCWSSHWDKVPIPRGTFPLDGVWADVRVGV